eukprot:1976147-Rhodomonas_salina.1
MVHGAWCMACGGGTVSACAGCAEQALAACAQRVHGAHGVQGRRSAHRMQAADHRRAQVALGVAAMQEGGRAASDAQHVTPLLQPTCPICHCRVR